MLTERMMMYLSKEIDHHKGGTTASYYATNYDGTVKFPIYRIRHSRKHNIGTERDDVWFKDSDGSWWYGVSYGTMNTVLHCRKLKRKSRRM